MADDGVISRYSEYLELDSLLNCQVLESTKRGATAHDEMLFIIVHQVYELWFKEIIHELDSIIKIFSGEAVDERSMGLALSRVGRVIEIEKILIDQIRVIETLTPLDFLDFRNYLGAKSGFQSVQFRLVENKLGLRPEQRNTYGGQSYRQDQSPADQELLATSESSASLFSVIDAWLSRTPFLEFKKYSFLNEYKSAVSRMLADERQNINGETHISAHEKEVRLKRLEADQTNYDQLCNPNGYSELIKQGERRLSFKACFAALFINLYRDEPILHLPFRLLSRIVELDVNMNAWRYHHALMVMRMIGTRIGTGGSSGYEYLQSTVGKHSVFGDLVAVNTLMLPRQYVPKLPQELKRSMDFFYKGLGE